ncbi:putative phosphatase 1 regulatory subunit 42-like [Homarus americanus]|uniref:Putative phosphatase 1 regulatory subunit 42-like n=2 Tax=Homarus americanus TaxID=6706 RepID=A0A8J5TL32_HOMAM|nr:putative phosphatase 1 regulatory subunit 42-like [Homarus americanus]
MIQREKLSRPPTHPQGDTPPPNSQEPIRMEKHLLFTSATPSDHTESVATGPRFVLGALRRPEFDLILRRAQQRSMAATASSLDVELQLGIREWSTLETAEGNVAPSNSREGLANQDSSGNDLTDTDAPSQEGVAHDAQWSTNLSPEKSVWFAGGEEPFIDDLPRLVPRPYWRNKPPVPRTNTTTTT